MAECIPVKPRWCLNEHGVKCISVLSSPTDNTAL